MLGVLACSIGPLAPPDPWDEFLYGMVWPFVRLNLNAGAVLLALVVLTALILGLFADLSARDRRVCGAVPLLFAAALSVTVFYGMGDRRWWSLHPELQTTLLAFAFGAGTLGLLIVERRLFIAEVSEPTTCCGE